MEKLEGQYSILNGNYLERADPVVKCSEATRSKGYEYFGVQNGGLCFASANKLYDSKGADVGCQNGLGGIDKNDVYRVFQSKSNY